MEKSHSLSHRRMSFRSFYFFFLIIFSKNISRGLKSTEHTHRFDKQNSISSFSSFSRRFSPSMQRTSSGVASTVECLFEHFFFFVYFVTRQSKLNWQTNQTHIVNNCESIWIVVEKSTVVIFVWHVRMWISRLELICMSCGWLTCSHFNSIQLIVILISI